MLRLGNSDDVFACENTLCDWVTGEMDGVRALCAALPRSALRRLSLGARTNVRYEDLADNFEEEMTLGAFLAERPGFVLKVGSTL